MTHHRLEQRSETEVLWYQRRNFLQAAAAWTALGGFAAAHAQDRSNVVLLQGEAQVNGAPLAPGQSLQSGDQITTAAGSTLIFVVGNAAFHVRQNSVVSVQGNDSRTVNLLRLITGAVVSVWGKGHARKIVTPTVTAGIRGTGVYTEVFANQDNRSYFCNCYGTVDLSGGADTVTSQADYHEAFWAEATPQNGRMLTPGEALNHTDEEVEFLAKLINEQTAWQISGRKGNTYGGKGVSRY